MQKVMIVHTQQNHLRASIDGWKFEDGDNVLEAVVKRIGTENEYSNPNDVPVGLISSGKYPLHPTVLHALGDGWRLLAPPVLIDTEFLDEAKIYKWWLVRD